VTRALRIAALLLLALPAGALAQTLRFRNAESDWGVDFRHHNGGSGQRYMVETMVGGVVMFDFDGDGDEDLLFVDGAALPGYQGDEARSRLYRNDGGRFVDHTEFAGLAIEGYGCGAVAGDYDDDGDVDLYITAFGANTLWRNQGNGTFVETTAEAGVGESLWSAGASFADADRDGDLDLYVTNYVDFALDNNRFCGDEEAGLQGYCSPDVFNALKDVYFRNRGDGSFEDFTQEAGFEGPLGAGLGVIFGDLDNDGWLDLYVANDYDPNLLFRNRGDGSFENASLLSGTGYGSSGMAEAGMGVDFGDVDRDGLLDIVVTNFELETNVLYRNFGEGLFADARFSHNVAEASLLNLAFGVDLADFDNDGDLDMVIANGHILDNAEKFNQRSRFEQENQVLENLGTGRFRVVEDPGFEDVLVSRGLATGDLDRDGDLDVAVINSNGPAVIYENLQPAGAGWLQIDLIGDATNSYGIGARVAVNDAASRQIDEVRTSSSYLSQNALTLHFGLGPPQSMPGQIGVEIDWPSGRRQSFSVPASVRVKLVESVAGTGDQVPGD
jgi:hypothetical protein